VFTTVCCLLASRKPHTLPGRVGRKLFFKLMSWFARTRETSGNTELAGYQKEGFCSKTPKRGTEMIHDEPTESGTLINCIK